jgi:hypothetical protein
MEALKILALFIAAVAICGLSARIALWYLGRDDKVDPHDDLATAQRQLEEAEHDLALIDNQIRQTHINTIQDTCAIIAKNAHTEGLRALPTQGSDRELTDAIATARAFLNRIVETARLNITLAQSLIDDKAEATRCFSGALVDLVATHERSIAVFAREKDVPQTLARQLVALYLRGELANSLQRANLVADDVAFLDDLSFEDARSIRRSTATLRDAIAQQIAAGTLVLVYSGFNLIVPGAGEIPNHTVVTRDQAAAWTHVR